MKIGGSKILVTGGCGLIGSTTIDLLLRDHHPDKIVIFDNLVRGSTANVQAAFKTRVSNSSRGTSEISIGSMR